MKKQRKRIYKLHQLEGSLTYIERMEIIEEGKGSMEVEFVRGELSEGMTLCFYDNQGKEYWKRRDSRNLYWKGRR